MITCKVCKVKKPRDDFYADLSKKNGLRPECKKCTRQRVAEYRQRNPEKVKQGYHRYNTSEHGRKIRRVLKLRTQYKLTPKQHGQIYLDQNGCCALCDEPVAYEKINTDHDHDTGKVRGLLCHRCNMGLGFWGDSVKGFQRAIRYLEVGGS